MHHKVGAVISVCMLFTHIHRHKTERDIVSILDQNKREREREELLRAVLYCTHIHMHTA